uniref:Uncharacterized protein n=1 Tax=Romanomermis culicivorax TaxID=13658 RepID=A0A915HSM5_ROMCU
MGMGRGTFSNDSSIGLGSKGKIFDPKRSTVTLLLVAVRRESTKRCVPAGKISNEHTCTGWKFCFEPGDSGMAWTASDSSPVPDSMSVSTVACSCLCWLFLCRPLVPSPLDLDCCCMESVFLPKGSTMTDGTFAASKKQEHFYLLSIEKVTNNYME